VERISSRNGKTEAVAVELWIEFAALETGAGNSRQSRRLASRTGCPSPMVPCPFVHTCTCPVRILRGFLFP
jgi:hypothetical protein